MNKNILEKYYNDLDCIKKNKEINIKLKKEFNDIYNKFINSNLFKKLDINKNNNKKIILINKINNEINNNNELINNLKKNINIIKNNIINLKNKTKLLQNNINNIINNINKDKENLLEIKNKYKTEIINKITELNNIYNIKIYNLYEGSIFNNKIFFNLFNLIKELPKDELIKYINIKNKNNENSFLDFDENYINIIIEIIIRYYISFCNYINYYMINEIIIIDGRYYIKDINFNSYPIFISYNYDKIEFKIYNKCLIGIELFLINIINTLNYCNKMKIIKNKNILKKKKINYDNCLYYLFKLFY